MLETTYINERVELLDCIYGPSRQAQYNAVTKLYNRVLGPVTSVNVHRPDLADFPFYSSSCNHSPIGSILRDLTYREGVADSIFIPGGGKGAGCAATILRSPRRGC